VFFKEIYFSTLKIATLADYIQRSIAVVNAAIVGLAPRLKFCTGNIVFYQGKTFIPRYETALTSLYSKHLRVPEYKTAFAHW
jgi:hypothetical protein